MNQESRDVKLKEIKQFLEDNLNVKKLLEDAIFPKNEKSTAEQLLEALEKFADAAVESVKATREVSEEMNKHVNFELTNVDFGTMQYTITVTALDEKGKEIIEELGKNNFLN